MIFNTWLVNVLVHVHLKECPVNIYWSWAGFIMIFFMYTTTVSYLSLCRVCLGITINVLYHGFHWTTKYYLWLLTPQKVFFRRSSGIRRFSRGSAGLFLHNRKLHTQFLTVDRHFLSLYIPKKTSNYFLFEMPFIHTVLFFLATLQIQDRQKFIERISKQNRYPEGFVNNTRTEHNIIKLKKLCFTNKPTNLQYPQS